ncbi:hypothetical protein PR048_011852 [Dryococelus australis]|uniref:Uncharacterized protein n=1 Tax=Dryococelus australis TaxID=614101 RepID=A0ABQ9HND9_9NEOP|nr:hypothetical protein PR048_011852 [Dryococelus australis]
METNMVDWNKMATGNKMVGEQNGQDRLTLKGIVTKNRRAGATQVTLNFNQHLERPVSTITVRRELHKSCSFSGNCRGHSDLVLAHVEGTRICHVTVTARGTAVARCELHKIACPLCVPTFSHRTDLAGSAKPISVSQLSTALLGAAVVQCSTLASHRGDPGSIPDSRMWESCWTMPLAGGFSRVVGFGMLTAKGLGSRSAGAGHRHVVTSLSTIMDVIDLSPHTLVTFELDLAPEDLSPLKTLNKP